jgi:hypothetical protein
MGPIDVTGAATGIVISTTSIPQTDPVPDSRARLGGGSPASLTGSVATNGSIANGLVAGDVSFGNTQGASIACNSGTVGWSLSRVGG